MTDALETQSATRSSSTPPQWLLQIAHHRDTSVVGRRVVVGDETIVLGRESDAFGVGAFGGGSISRTHARISRSASGEVLLEDTGSRNGTFLNSARVQSEHLAAGDVIALGNTLLLLTREPQAPAQPPAPPASFVAFSATVSAALHTARTAASRGPCLIFGESGAGKSTLANVLHESRSDAASLRTFTASQARFDGEPVPRETWLIESLESLSAPAQAQLLEVLPSLSARGVALVCCSCEAPAQLRQKLDARLLNRLCRWTIEVPPLRRRRADIMPLALAFVDRYRGQRSPFEADLAYAFVRHAWPGNLHELEALVERAVVETPEGAPIAGFPGLAAALLSPPGSRELSSIALLPSAPPVHVAADGSWFRTPGDERVDLSRRDVLRRVLCAFVEAHQRWPGRSMTVQEVVERGWPGERMTTKAGANRAYVALATLRKLGLRDVLIRDDAGYWLATTVAVEPG